MSDRKVFQNSVIELPAQDGLTPNGLMVSAAEPEHRDEKMTVHFSYSIPSDQESDLEERVARGEVVPREELESKFAPRPEDRDKLLSWLKDEGFEIVDVSKDGMSIYAKATVGRIEKSLDVNMARVTKDGITYTAAQDAPSLPSDVANGINGISGLQPFLRAHKNNRKYLPTDPNRLNMTEEEKIAAGTVGIAPATNVMNAPPFMVAEILKAYDADNLAVTGRGQTIAILIDTFPKDADLEAFWEQNNLPVKLSQIQKINVSGGPLPPREGEETLDTEWASGIAPGANIRIYASGSLSFVALGRALDRIIADLNDHPEMRQLSISLGLGETFMPPGEVTTQHQKFLRLAASGVNVFVSSGDAGSNPDSSGHGSTGPTQTEYESSDSSVIGVGGTSLNLAVDGSVVTETGWSGSGGGRSSIFKRQPWQSGNGVPQGNDRLVPDVSLAADPNTGAFLIFQGKPIQIGGTSWSAPVWAGFCALINEARQAAGKPLLPFLNPLIYPLLTSDCFRDITLGSNGSFSANNGYDMVTGIGVPNVRNLIQTLA